MLQYTRATNETERECFLLSNPLLRCAWASFYMLKGSPTGGNVNEGKNVKRRGGWYSYLYSASYLTLTAGDKGLKCPSASPKQCKKERQGRHRLPRRQSCQRRLPLRTAGCTASRHVRLEGSQSDTLVDVLERGHRVVARRGKRLAAVVVLSRPEACRSPGVAGTRGASRQVP